MAKFKINVVGLLLANNLMAKAGEFIDEKAFASPAADLVKSGHIVKPTKAELDQIAKNENSSAAKAAEEAAKAAEEAATKAAEEAVKK